MPAAGWSGSASSSNKRRKKQARAIAEILGEYNLKKDWVIVAGDLNDTPDSDPLEPLLSVPNLHDVLELEFGSDMTKRWTYHYRKFEQIDYILVSEPLKKKFVEAGVQRRGMYDLEALTKKDPSVATQKEYPSVTHWTNAASDHGAVWAEFKL